jgi:uncharacterized protein YlzI (FlbEa/FlbD family)
MEIVSYSIPAFLKAAELLEKFKTSSLHLQEQERLNQAFRLCEIWKKNKITMAIPALPERQDVWYLVQLLAKEKHILINGDPYILNPGMRETIYTHPDLFHMLYKRATFSIQKTITIKSNTLYVSRKTLDRMIDTAGSDVLTRFGFSLKQWRIAPIPYDMLLRLTLNKHFRFNDNVFFDGYRSHPTGERTALFGGGTLFGGPSYIDSVWMDMPIRINPFLVIIRKNYGTL